MTSGIYEPKNFAIIDVETTGVSDVRDRIIEIGILRIEGGKCVETFETCINPGRYVSPWIFNLTGISPAELEDAPLFEDVASTIERLLQGAVFVAHNVGFDYAFIKNEFLRSELWFEASTLDTVRLSRALSPRAKRHGLSQLIARHKFACVRRHRAFDDAAVLWQFFEWGMARHGEKCTAAIERLIRKPAHQYYAVDPYEAIVEL
jgi:DNA polymerase-3 subunit epsilon